MQRGSIIKLRKLDRRQLLKTAGLAVGIPPAALMGSLKIAKASRRTNIRRSYADGRHGQIHYWTAGDGPPLVLIHQTLKTSDEFVNLAPYLADQFRLIAIDLPGHGNSADPPGPHTMENLTNAVIDVADHLKLDKFNALGHHGGALVVSNLGATIPRRIDKLILSGTSGPSQTVLSKDDKAGRLKLIQRQFDPDEAGEEILRVWKNIVRQRSADAEVRDAIAPFLDSVETRMRPYEILSVYFTWDRVPAQESLKMPVLLIQGELDAAVQNQEGLLDRIPSATRVMLPKCGVFAFYDCPEDLAKVIRDFLS